VLLVPPCPASPTSAHEGHPHPIGWHEGTLVPSRDRAELPFISRATTQGGRPSGGDRPFSLAREEQQQPADGIADHEREQRELPGHRLTGREEPDCPVVR
jgi:hypothetical protein